MILFKVLSDKVCAINKKTWIWIGLALVTLPALHIFYVQEMLAAIIVLFILFLAGSTAAVTIFLLVLACRPVAAWAIPHFRRLVQRVADAFNGILASPVWARVVPYLIRREQLQWAELRLSEKCKRAYSSFAVLGLNAVCKIGVRMGGAVRIIGLSTQKSMSNRVGYWLTQRVSYSDFFRFAPRSQARLYAARYRHPQPDDKR